MNLADAVALTNGLLVGAITVIIVLGGYIFHAIERQTKVLQEIRELLLRRN